MGNGIQDTNTVFYFPNLRDPIVQIFYFMLNKLVIGNDFVKPYTKSAHIKNLHA